MSAPGSNHESASDDRDNPTYDNFKTNTPVKKTRTRGPSERALNREGRAICRIVSAHEWPVRKIALIFGISRQVITRAIDNEYLPPDVVSEDYTHLKDPEFSKHFPPGAVAPRTKFQHRKRSESPLTTSDEDSSEDESKPSSSRVLLKRKCVGDGRPPPTSVSGAFTAKKPRHFSSSASSGQGSDSDSESLSPPTRPPTSTFIPALPRYKPRSSTKTYLLSPILIPTTLSVFLKSVNQIDLSAHLSLLSARGFTLERIRIMGAMWTDAMIKQAVERGLCEGEDEDKWKGMSAFDALTLELAIRKLRCKAESSSPNSNSNPATLSAFLSNVVGFDLTAHRALLESQGFDIDRLRAMREWEEGDLREVLARALRPGGEGEGGMFKLEILAVEFALKSW
ncbi:hypothetical protein FB45DRAFT_906928 [Roridomyces roridus]|uniref:Uncharacterized protein n=1 Tax=Roridomyces roridus TaxID=1738132 RepID=A0AAD7C1I6_9AGAR|nr:hypothetical protein FB45DRAFT_906928 [Roridomyces roridus]